MAKKKKSKSAKTKKKAKKPAKKVVKKLKRKAGKPKKTKKAAKKKKAAAPKVNYGQRIGVVTHYFPHVKAGVVLVEKGPLAAGEFIHIKGATTDFKQTIDSMQINHVPVQSADSGQEIGLLTKSRVRQHDVVYRPPKKA